MRSKNPFFTVFALNHYEVVLLRSFTKFMVDILQMAFINHQIKQEKKTHTMNLIWKFDSFP